MSSQYPYIRQAIPRIVSQSSEGRGLLVKDAEVNRKNWELKMKRYSAWRLFKRRSIRGILSVAQHHKLFICARLSESCDDSNQETSTGIRRHYLTTARQLVSEQPSYHPTICSPMQLFRVGSLLMLSWQPKIPYRMTSRIGRWKSTQACNDWSQDIFTLIYSLISASRSLDHP